MSEATRWMLTIMLGIMFGASLVLLFKDYGNWTPKVGGVVGLVMCGLLLYEMIRQGAFKP